MIIQFRSTIQQIRKQIFEVEIIGWISKQLQYHQNLDKYPIFLNLTAKFLYLSFEDVRAHIQDFNQEYEIQIASTHYAVLEKKIDAAYNMSNLYVQNLKDIQHFGLLIYDLKDIKDKFIYGTIESLSAIIQVSRNMSKQKQCNLLQKIKLSLLFCLNIDAFYLQVSKCLMLKYKIECRQYSLLKNTINSFLMNNKTSKCFSNINLFMNNQLIVAKGKRNEKIVFIYNKQPYILIHLRAIIKSVSQMIFGRESLNSFSLSTGYFSKNFTSATQYLFNHKQSIIVLQHQNVDWNQILLAILNNTLYLYQQQAIHKHQISQLSSIKKVTIPYFLRTRNILLAIKCLKLNQMKPQTVKCGCLFEAFYPICSPNKQQNSIKQIRQLLHSKRRSMSIEINIHKFSSCVKKIIENQMSYQLGIILLNNFGEQFNVPLYQLHQNIISLKNDLNYQDNQFIKLFQQVQQIKDCQNQQKLQKCQQILNIIENKISTNYYYAQVYESLLGQLIDTMQINLEQRLNKIILTLSIIMMDYNYQQKQKLLSLSKIDIFEDNWHFKLNKNIIKYNNHNCMTILTKVNYIINENKLALSIIYPLGSRVYNIATFNTILITYVQRWCFEDQYEIVQNIIKNNQQVLSSQVIEISQWWKSRHRLNRELGKICNNIDLGIWDCQIEQSEPLFYKFLGYQYEYIAKYLKICFNKEVQKIQKQLKSKKLIGSHSKNNLLIYTHQKYYRFPYQIIKAVSLYQGIYRIPSINFLIKRQFKTQIQSVEEISYLINPANDLKKTQESFKKIKKSYDRWKGDIGTKPNLTRYKQLINQNVFLYMGHGNGISELSQTDFNRVERKCISLLFGCGSAAMTYDSSEPHGVAFSYLLKGSPSLLGCLWSVTDADTDEVTTKIFENIKRQPTNLSKLTQQSKQKCKLAYLNGAALVVFGIPTYLYK